MSSNGRGLNDKNPRARVQSPGRLESLGSQSGETVGFEGYCSPARSAIARQSRSPRALARPHLNILF